MKSLSQIVREFYIKTNKDLVIMDPAELYENEQYMLDYFGILYDDVSEKKQQMFDHVFHFANIYMREQLCFPGKQSYQSWVNFQPVYLQRYIQFSPVIDYCECTGRTAPGSFDIAALKAHSSANIGDIEAKIVLGIKKIQRTIDAMMFLKENITFSKKLYANHFSEYEKFPGSPAIEYMDGFLTSIAYNNCMSHHKQRIDELMKCAIKMGHIDNVYLSERLETDKKKDLFVKLAEMSARIYVDTMMGGGNIIFVSPYDAHLFNEMTAQYPVVEPSLYSTEKLMDYKIIRTDAVPRNVCCMTYFSESAGRNNLYEHYVVPSMIFPDGSDDSRIFEVTRRTFTIAKEESVRLLVLNY